MPNHELPVHRPQPFVVPTWRPSPLVRAPVLELGRKSSSQVDMTRLLLGFSLGSPPMAVHRIIRNAGHVTEEGKNDNKGEIHTVAWHRTTTRLKPSRMLGLPRFSMLYQPSKSSAMYRKAHE